jgi:F-type H+-transporting ATPase subunit b
LQFDAAQRFLHSRIALTEPVSDANLFVPSRQLKAHRVLVWGVRTARLPAKVQAKNFSMAIVHQLGELFLGAVPTVLLVLIFYFLMKSLFFKPLLAVMAERDARSIGAQKAAEAAQAAAAEKLKQYQDALKRERTKLYAEQEAARKKILDERAAIAKKARAKSADEVSAAKKRVAAELDVARRDVEAGISQLAAEIASRVLQSPASPSREVR